jgi:hypothetical protein
MMRKLRISDFGFRIFHSMSHGPRPRPVPAGEQEQRQGADAADREDADDIDVRQRGGLLREAAVKLAVGLQDGIGKSRAGPE